MTEDVELYWKSFEAETGEHVEARAMGQWCREGGEREGTWGMLILTDRSFRFRSTPSDNWFTKLLPGARSRNAAKLPEEIVVARETIDSLDLPHRGFFDRLFGPSWPSFRLTWHEAQVYGPGAAARSERFIVSDDGGFLRGLAKAFPRKA